MTTFFQPGGPRVGGPYPGSTAEPQQYYPAAGPAGAPAPQVDYHHPYPAYRTEQAAWSQPAHLPVPQHYQPPAWGAPAPAGADRNKLIAVVIAVALLLVAGVVTLIVVVNKGDGAAPVGPQTPNPTAPVASTPTAAGPAQPRPLPGAPAVHPTDAPTVPAQSVPAQSVPAQSVPAQTVPAQTVPDQPADGPDQQEAERAAGGFVAALSSSDFTGAAGYICSAKAAAFAAGASQLSTKVQLATLALSGVQVTGTTATMTMTYQAVGQSQIMSESLPMTIESGVWKICN